MADGKNPFDDKFFEGVLSDLQAFDKRAEQQAHDRQFTADGVKLEKGLEVWCVDYPLGKIPWVLRSKDNRENTWSMSHISSKEKRTTASRDANYRVMYAHKAKAMSARMDKLKKEMDDINDKEIIPRGREIMQLAKMAAKDLGMPEKDIDDMLRGKIDEQSSM